MQDAGCGMRDAGCGMWDGCGLRVRDEECGVQDLQDFLAGLIGSTETAVSMSYRNLEIWRLAKELVVDIHRLTLTQLPKFEMFEEGAQIRKSIKSVKSRPSSRATGAGGTSRSSFGS